ncbi:MAG: transposase [Verrucomicrobia bacterium]|nr:transposase [Verrucomicrobiota bacterium]
MKTSSPDQQCQTGVSGLRAAHRILFHAIAPDLRVNITERKLPHWTQLGATYFVTFRLADSIPQSLLLEWQHEREIWLRLHPEPWSPQVEAEYHHRFTRRMEDWLDTGAGECHLRRPDIRAAVERHLLHFDGQQYDVDAYVLMPNHGHCLITPCAPHSLSKVMRGIKGVSAHTCNKLLACTGQTFWQDESHDHIVRDGDELERLRRYIANNPVKAKLREGEYTLSLREVLYVEAS